MRIELSSPERLVLHDRVGCFWLLGGFFVLLGSLFLAGLLGLFSDLEELTFAERLLAWSLALAAVGAGFHVAYRSPTSRATFDRNRDSFAIVRKGLFRDERLEGSLSQMEEIFLVEGKDIDEGPVYRVAMRLHTGEEVPISLLWLHGKEHLDGVVEMVRGFLGASRIDPPESK